ncbi:MAPEG family protein [Roseixanthobacter liquoris]|uniref:MAPEG family protein n=1 Tax=Roseixanthobacter liquoris TaxID=3119921 RepID=UPI00372ADB0D
MGFSSDQMGIVQGSAAALILAAAVVAAGYIWLPPGVLGLNPAMDFGGRIAFTLKANILMFVWLAGCVGAVSRGRFYSPADIRGSAFGSPSPAIAVRAAVLQNSLEQTVLAFAAHLTLATLLRGPELVLIPLLVAVFLVGRVAFAFGYAKGASGRAFGMALTAATIIASYGLAIGLVVVGR